MKPRILAAAALLTVAVYTIAYAYQGIYSGAQVDQAVGVGLGLTDHVHDDGDGDSPASIFKNGADQYGIFKLTSGGAFHIDANTGDATYIGLYPGENESVAVIPQTEGEGIDVHAVGSGTTVRLNVPVGTSILQITGGILPTEESLIRFYSYTVATLPAAAAGNSGALVWVTDGDDDSDCTTGGGANVVGCRSTGASWVAATTGGAGSGLPSNFSDETGDMGIAADANFVPTSTTTGHKYTLQAYDVDGASIVDCLSIVNGDNPLILIESGCRLSGLGGLYIDTIESVSTDTNLTFSGNGTGIVEVDDDLNVTGDIFGDTLTSTTTDTDLTLDGNGTGTVVVDDDLDVTGGITGDTVTSNTTDTDLTLSGNGTGKVKVDDALIVTGTSLAKLNVVTKTAATYTVGADNAYESQGTLFINYDDDAITFTLDTAAAGKFVCFENAVTSAGAAVTAIITVTAGADDKLVNTGTAGSAAGSLASAGEAGDKICFAAIDAVHWNVESSTGTWAVP